MTVSSFGIRKGKRWLCTEQCGVCISRNLLISYLTGSQIWKAATGTASVGSEQGEELMLVGIRTLLYYIIIVLLKG